MKKKKLFTIGFILLFLLLFVLFWRIFFFKYGDGIYSLSAFYELEEDSVDAVILGSSHAFEDINPMIIWEDAGIAAFDLCGSDQPMWNSYYYLKEALKTQHPRLVILEAYCLVSDIEYSDDSRIIKNVYGMKPSMDKLEALKVSAPKERWLEFGLEYIQFHRRYAELTSEDYRDYLDNEPFYSSWKGFGNNFNITVFEENKIPNNSGNRLKIPEKQKEYYQKIISLCQERGIDLLIVVTPYHDYNETHMGIFNSAADLAESYDIPFFNYNDDYDIIALDCKTDFADAGHMSYLGNAKFTHYFTEELLRLYEWDSHGKGEAAYESWDDALKYYKNSVENHELTLINNAEEYAKALGELDDRYIVLALLPGEMSPFGTTAINDWLISRNVSLEDPHQNHVWVIDASGAQLVSETRYGYYWANRYGDKELLIDGEGIYWNRESYKKTISGINLVIFDTENIEVADAVGIEADGRIVRN